MRFIVNSFLLWTTMNVFYFWIIFGNGAKVFEYFEDLPIISFLTANRSQEIIRSTAIMACILCNIMMFYDVFIKDKQAEIPLHHGYFKMFWRTLEGIFL